MGQLQLLGATTDESNPHVTGAVGGRPMLLPVQTIGSTYPPGQADPDGQDVQPSNPVVKFIYVPPGQESGKPQATAGKPPFKVNSYALSTTLPVESNLLGITTAASPFASTGTRREGQRDGAAVPPLQE